MLLGAAGTGVAGAGGGGGGGGSAVGSRPTPMTQQPPHQQLVSIPYIDNDLLWCPPDNDAVKMVDLAVCLHDSSSVTSPHSTTSSNNTPTTPTLPHHHHHHHHHQTLGGALGELSQSDLSALISAAAAVGVGVGAGAPEDDDENNDAHMMVSQSHHQQNGGSGGSMDDDVDSEDLFKHLADPSFELDNLLNEFSAHDIKQEENNNSIHSLNTSSSASSFSSTLIDSLSHNKSNNSNSLNPNNPNSAVMLELRSTHVKFTIAAANPLLAEKLAAPSPSTSQMMNLLDHHQQQQNMQLLGNVLNSSSNSKAMEMAPLVPKLEKGKLMI